jgi:hypothetical protein
MSVSRASGCQRLTAQIADHSDGRTALLSGRMKNIFGKMQDHNAAQKLSSKPSVLYNPRPIPIHEEAR